MGLTSNSESQRRFWALAVDLTTGNIWIAREQCLVVEKQSSVGRGRWITFFACDCRGRCSLDMAFKGREGRPGPSNRSPPARNARRRWVLAWDGCSASTDKRVVHDDAANGRLTSPANL